MWGFSSLLLFAWWLPLPSLIVNVGLLNTKIYVQVLHIFTMCTEYGRCEYVFYLLRRDYGHHHLFHVMYPDRVPYNDIITLNTI
jgi:hypothetical protein